MPFELDQGIESADSGAVPGRGSGGVVHCKEAVLEGLDRSDLPIILDDAMENWSNIVEHTTHLSNREVKTMQVG